MYICIVVYIYAVYKLCTYIHIIILHVFSLAEQRSNESLKSGASSTYSAYQLQVVDKKGTGDNKGLISNPSAPTRRSSITSIKSFTAMLPSVPEAIESEPSNSDSSSGINMNIHSTSEVKSESADENMGQIVEIQIDKVAFSENQSVTSENEREDDRSMEIACETENEQHLPNSKVGSTPNIHIYQCTDVKRSKYKRRMSKSCDELDVKVKPDTTSSWKSWNNFLSAISNSMTRIRNGLSNSVSHVDQLVDAQNDEPPEENQLD